MALFLPPKVGFFPSTTAVTFPLATTNLYYALPITPDLLQSTDGTMESLTPWDTENEEELLKLMSVSPRTTSNILGKTVLERPKITFLNNTPFYRVLP